MSESWPGGVYDLGVSVNFNPTSKALIAKWFNETCVDVSPQWEQKNVDIFFPFPFGIPEIVLFPGDSFQIAPFFKPEISGKKQPALPGGALK